MLCLCLYMQVPILEQTEFEYFESDSLPAHLKSLFKLSLFLPSDEFTSYRKWRKVCHLHCVLQIKYFPVCLLSAFVLLVCCLYSKMKLRLIFRDYCSRWGVFCPLHACPTLIRNGINEFNLDCMTTDAQFHDTRANNNTHTVLKPSLKWE